MSSLIQGFAYDIFISYRHNDNRSGWVTDFVNALQEELAATIKEPLSIYFDKNPHDGLLETDNVDKSLEGKLKCLIFIPIISQTYCDPKSFAWRHEFCAFNTLSQEDQFGRDIRLSNGNVSSRILPIKIHYLDTEDKSIIENEIGGVLRAIEFIYKEPGVNRPLASDDSDDKNLNKTKYKNQVNKVANAIKEIITVLRRPASQIEANAVKTPGTVSEKTLTKKYIYAGLFLILISLAGYFTYTKIFRSQRPAGEIDRSIAVLPFADMSPDKNQAYLGDGIAEEIINVLSKVSGVNVIGRTSSFSLKDQGMDLVTIGEKLGVGTILEGSVRKSNNKIRITAQLINAKDGNHIWSQTYDRELNDIFEIQDDISKQIVEKFKLTLTLHNGQTAPTRDLEAYEFYLKGRKASFSGITKVLEAKEFIQQAIKLDTTFVAAYAALSEVYFSIGFYGIENTVTSYHRSKAAALKAIQLDPNSYLGYRQASWNDAFVDWNWQAALDNYHKAEETGLPLPDNYYAVFSVILLNNEEEGISIMKALVKRDPFSVEYLQDLTRVYLYAGQHENAIEVANKVLELDPDNSSAFRHLGEAYLFSGNPQKALSYYSRLMDKDSTYAPQGYIGSLVKLGRTAEAQLKLTSLGNSITSAKKAMCFIHLNERDSAFLYLDKAYREKDVYLPFIRVESHFKLLTGDPRYDDLIKRMNFPTE